MTADNSENQDIDCKIKLQDQAIQNLKNQFEESNKYQNLRKDVLDSQEKLIRNWMATIGISLALFGAFGTISFFVAENKIQEFKQLNKDAKIELEKIKQHTKTAKQGAADITKLKKETLDLLANPEEPLSLQVSAEVEQSGSKLEKQILIARKLQKDNKIEEAIILWWEIVGIAKHINKNQQLSSGYFNLGYLYDELGGKDNLQKAIAAYQKAIEIKPDKHEAYNNMGIAYRKLGGKDNLQKAIAAYQKAIEIKPDYYGAYNNMGLAYNDLGGEDNLQKAIAAYQNAIEIKPDGHEAYSNMGSAYDDLSGEDNLQKAIAAYQNAIEIKPNKDEAYYNMGIAYQKLGQYDKAINAYKQAIKINPEIVKHSKQQNWDELNTWIETVDDSATKQKYQAILRKLKGE